MSGVIGRLLPGGLWVGKLVRLLGAAPSSFPRRGCGAWAGFWLPRMTPYLPWQNPGTGSEGVSLETGSANGGAVIGVPFPAMSAPPREMGSCWGLLQS